MKIKSEIFVFLICLFCSAKNIAQQIQAQQVSGINNTNGVSLRIDTLPALDPNDKVRPRRFQAFWIPGDGNFIRYGSDGVMTTVEEDAQSVAPPPYFYPEAGNYEATAYLTGKYTNRKPPARAAKPINIPSVPVDGTMPVFQKRLEVGGKPLPTILDVFSNHAIRSNYLTTFVISWPADVNASGIYFFFNGYQNHITGENSKLTSNVLQYSNTEIPRYFQDNLDLTKIKSYQADQLAIGGAVDGMNFNPAFYSKMPRMFKDFIYYPAENATTAGMPRGFDENRYFPVIRTDAVLMPTDTLLNFYAILTGPQPLGDDSPAYQPLLSMLNIINSIVDDSGPSVGLSPGTPIALTSNQETLYIQAIAAYQLPYLATFDPNQLTVEDIKKIGDDNYEVTFRLEMCNQGQAAVHTEYIDIDFSSDYQGFEPVGFTALNSSLTPGHWSFHVDTTISEVMTEPGEHHDAACVAIFFKAKTNCKGVRALWNNSPEKPVKSCVVFEGAMSKVPECHFSEGIDSTQFLVDGKCECCRQGPDTGTCWPLWLLILLVVLLAIWWVYRQNNS